jgi:uncharacterized protein YjdB
MVRCTLAISLVSVIATGCSADAAADGRSVAPTMPVSSQVATVAVTPETSLLTVGDSLRLVAATRDAGGAPLVGRVVAWSSDAPAIATVSTAGVVRALSAGLVRVTALSEGRTGSATITATR